MLARLLRWLRRRPREPRVVAVLELDLAVWYAVRAGVPLRIEK